MRNPPPAEPAAASSTCIPAWYCSYFGTYTFDPAGGRWTTRVEGGNMPAYLGTEQARPFRIEGDPLIISGSYQQDGRTVRYERIAVRAD